MSIIITNVSDHPDVEGENDYALFINRKMIAHFKHVRKDGLGECLRKAAEAADKATEEGR